MPIITSGVQYSGIWNLSSQANAKALGTWPAAYNTFELYSWGVNGSGQLGLGNTTTYSSPKQVGALYWRSASISDNAAAAIASDGTLWTWGANASGQLGLGNTTNYSSPKQVGALTTWLKVYQVRQSAVAIKTDGTLWAWGSGGSGRLGLGNTTNYSSPKQVGSLTNWLSFAGGNYLVGSCLATKTDGTLWAWGVNANGQLGLGNTTNYSSPVQVGALTNWLKVATSYSTWAIKTDGTLWSWGKNNTGALGLGNSTSYSSPKQVGALTAWLNVSGGGYYANAVASKTDGTLWTWGYGAIGSLGLGNTTSYNSPKQVGALTTWLAVASGGEGQAFSIKTDGTLWAWGKNTSGQLGLGDATNRSSPVQVGSDIWFQITTGQSCTIAV